MVNFGAVVIYALLLLLPAYYLKMAATGIHLYSKLYLTASYGTGAVTDGELAVVEGTVVVDEPPYAAGKMAENTDSIVGAYLWRLTFPKMQNRIDFENWEIKEHTVTSQSEIESGRFSVDTGDETVRVDLNWLLDTHDGTRLPELTVSSTRSQRWLRPYLWDSPFIHLSGDETVRTVEAVEDVFEGYDGNPSNDRTIESKPIHDGTTIAVCGDIRFEQGTPVIYGSDIVPLAITDGGFDGFRKSLRLRIVKNSIWFLLSIGFIAVVWIFS